MTSSRTLGIPFSPPPAVGQPASMQHSGQQTSLALDPAQSLSPSQLATSGQHLLALLSLLRLPFCNRKTRSSRSSPQSQPLPPAGAGRSRCRAHTNAQLQLNLWQCAQTPVSQQNSSRASQLRQHSLPGSCRVVRPPPSSSLGGV